MDNSSRNRPGDHLGVNRIGKNIRKSPLHQPNFPNQKQQQQQQGGGGNQQQQQPPPPQPQVYNINKNDFRSIVQQLTGTPTREPFPGPNPPPPAAAARAPAHNPPRPPSTRLQRIRPPPLAPFPRPPAPHANPQPPPHPLMHNPNFYPRPMPASAAPPAPSPGVPFSPLLPLTPPPGNAFLANTLESPISAYMRYLESSISSSDGFRQTPQQMSTQQQQQMQQIMPPPPHVHQGQGHVAGPPAHSTDMLRNPHAGAPFPSPGAFGHPFPSPPGLLPSPSSQFLLPSPSAFLNLLSPRSPFPLPSPRLPMTPNFALSPMGGQYLGPQPPLSPGLVFPPSPSGFFPMVSPRWRDL